MTYRFFWKEFKTPQEASLFCREMAKLGENLHEGEGMVTCSTWLSGGQDMLILPHHHKSEEGKKFWADHVLPEVEAWLRESARLEKLEQFDDGD